MEAQPTVRPHDTAPGFELHFRSPDRNLSTLNDTKTAEDEQAQRSYLSTQQKKTVHFKVTGSNYFSTKYTLSVNKKDELCLHRRVFLSFHIRIKIEETRIDSQDHRVWVAILNNKELSASVAAKAFISDSSLSFMNALETQRVKEIRKYTLIGHFEIPSEQLINLKSNDHDRWNSILSNHEYKLFCERMEQFPDWLYIELKDKLTYEHPRHGRERELFKLNSYLLRYLTNHEGNYQHRLMIVCRLLSRCSKLTLSSTLSPHPALSDVGETQQSTDAVAEIGETSTQSAFQVKFGQFVNSLPNDIKHDLFAGLWLFTQKQRETASPSSTTTDTERNNHSAHSQTLNLQIQQSQEIQPIEVTPLETSVHFAPQSIFAFSDSLFIQNLISQWANTDFKDFCSFLNTHQANPTMIYFFLECLLNSIPNTIDQLDMITRLTTHLCNNNLIQLKELSLSIENVETDARRDTVKLWGADIYTSPEKLSEGVNQLTEEIKIHQTLKIYISQLTCTTPMLEAVKQNLTILFEKLNRGPREILIKKIDAFDLNLADTEHKAIRLNTGTTQFRGTLKKQAATNYSPIERNGVDIKEQARLDTLPEIHIKPTLVSSWVRNINGFCHFLNTLEISLDDEAGDDDDTFAWFIQAAITEQDINPSNIDRYATRALQILHHLDNKHAIEFINQLQSLIEENFCFHIAKQLLPSKAYNATFDLSQNDEMLVSEAKSSIKLLMFHCQAEQQLKLIDAICCIEGGVTLISQELIIGMNIPLGNCSNPLMAEQIRTPRNISNYCLLYETGEVAYDSEERVKAIAKKYYKWIAQLDRQLTQVSNDEKKKIIQKRENLKETLVHYLHFLPYSSRSKLLQALLEEERSQIEIEPRTATNAAQPCIFTGEINEHATNAEITSSVEDTAETLANDGLKQDIAALWNKCEDEGETQDVTNTRESDLIIECYRRRFNVLVFQEEFENYYSLHFVGKTPNEEQITQLINLFTAGTALIKKQKLYSEEVIDRFATLLTIYKKQPELQKIFVKQLLDIEEEYSLKVLGYYLVKEVGFSFDIADVDLSLKRFNQLKPTLWVNMQSNKVKSSSDIARLTRFANSLSYKVEKDPNSKTRRFTIAGVNRHKPDTDIRDRSVPQPPSATLSGRNTFLRNRSRRVPVAPSADDETYVMIEEDTESLAPTAINRATTSTTELPPAQPNRAYSQRLLSRSRTGAVTKRSFYNKRGHLQKIAQEE